MSKRERVTRPEVDRIEPDRSFSAAFVPPSDVAPRAASDAPPASREAAAGNGRDASYEAVNSAYRVIDEYMRQGQRFAEEFWLPSSDGSSANAQFPRMLERFLRSAGDMGTAWIEMMTAGVRPPPADTGARGTAGPFVAGRRPEPPSEPAAEVAPAAAGFSIAIESTRRVRVSVDASNGLLDTEALPLTGADRALAHTRGPVVQIEATDGRTVLRVVVPEDQAAGAYHGVLLDRRSQRPVGTISVRVE